MLYRRLFPIFTFIFLRLLLDFLYDQMVFSELFLEGWVIEVVLYFESGESCCFSLEEHDIGLDFTFDKCCFLAVVQPSIGISKHTFNVLFSYPVPSHDDFVFRPRHKRLFQSHLLMVHMPSIYQSLEITFCDFGLF